jgi:hypothetical protein
MIVKEKVSWVGDGFVFKFEPVQDTISVEKTKKGYRVSYLSFDRDCESPEADSDGSLFLVHYHRSFYVSGEPFVCEQDLRDWWCGAKIIHEREYFVFPVSSLIHSGVSLKLGRGGFAEDSGGFDTSHVGAVFASKKEFKTQEDAERAAASLIQIWNQYLCGDVYGCVVEHYDKNKIPLRYECAWGSYGLEVSMQRLKEV